MIRSVIDEIIYKMNSHRYERLKLTDLAISSLQNINCNGLNAIYEDPYSQYKDVVLLEYVNNQFFDIPQARYYTVIDRNTIDCVKDMYWESWFNRKNPNRYIINKRKRILLHRYIWKEYNNTSLTRKIVIHHKSSAFDNRINMISCVNQEKHDRHRAYTRDLVI